MPPVATMDRLKKLARAKRSLIVLGVLVLAILAVYGHMLLSRPVRAAGLSPEVAKIMAQNAGKPLQFPMFHPGHHFNRSAWRTMTPAQRRAMWQNRRAHFEAFLLAFARATPAQQQAVVRQMKARFKMMHAKWKAAHPQNGGNGPGHGHGHGPGGNFAARLPQMMARGLASGNPQMHAAMNQFFMAMHNTR